MVPRMGLKAHRQHALHAFTSLRPQHSSHKPTLALRTWSAAGPLHFQHAYYLQYKNVRPDYLKAIWRVVNWGNVENRLAAAKK